MLGLRGFGLGIFFGFQVFEPVIEGNLGLSAEEIETALIANNHDLARIHIALIKV